MLDPTTNWFKMSQITIKTAAEIADISKGIGLLVIQSHSEFFLSWYQIYCWIFQDVSKWLWTQKETNDN